MCDKKNDTGIKSNSLWRENVSLCSVQGVRLLEQDRAGARGVPAQTASTVQRRQRQHRLRLSGDGICRVVRRVVWPAAAADHSGVANATELHVRDLGDKTHIKIRRQPGTGRPLYENFDLSHDEARDLFMQLGTIVG